MNIPVCVDEIVPAVDAETALDEIAAGLKAGQIVPYLGPGVLAAEAAVVPVSPEAIAAFLGRRIALPRRARTDAWAAAQYVESYKHRSTLVALMSEAYSMPSPLSAIHRGLATLRLPMIVDTWYDGTMRAALAERADWGEIQGISRAGLGHDRWFRAYDAAGDEAAPASSKNWTTLLYKPMGAVVPAANFIVADSDYVEVLTEIDIQSPIPDEVKDRRQGRGFLFLGCRFNDQTLRVYARQILKRSGGTHFAILDTNGLARNEIRFLNEQRIRPVFLPLARIAEILAEL